MRQDVLAVTKLALTESSQRHNKEQTESELIPYVRPELGDNKTTSCEQLGQQPTPPLPVL